MLTSVADIIIESGFRVIIWMLFLWMDKQVPVIRHIDEDEMWLYRYPSVPSTVPKHYLYMIIFGVPTVLLTFQYLINRKDSTTIPDIVNTANGITLSYCINGIVTSVLKLAIGRPRPNFFLRCFPDGYGTDIDNCTGEYQGMMDGRKSFPSGHASFAFTGMIYMMLHFNKLLNLSKPRFARGIVIFGLMALPLLASLVAASRCADYHHHYSDVIGGAILGSAIASVIHSFYQQLDETEQQLILKNLSKYADSLGHKGISG